MGDKRTYRRAVCALLLGVSFAFCNVVKAQSALVTAFPKEEMASGKIPVYKDASCHRLLGQVQDISTAEKELFHGFDIIGFRGDKLQVSVWRFDSRDNESHYLYDGWVESKYLVVYGRSRIYKASHTYHQFFSHPRRDAKYHLYDVQAIGDVFGIVEMKSGWIKVRATDSAGTRIEGWIPVENTCPQMFTTCN